MNRHFLSLQDFSPEELRQLIARASDMKKNLRQVQEQAPAKGMILGMIFEKASTRTRVSFEAGITQLGGNAIFLSSKNTQIGRGEPVEDTARVLSSMIDIIMVRTFSHANLERFAEYSSVPVINALTDSFHPCQLLADMQTYNEFRGDIRGKTITWVGDGNNMCQSYMSAAERFGFTLNIACPPGYEPSDDFVNQFKDHIVLSNDVKAMCDNSDVLVTDVWTSMGQEEESKKRRVDFADYQVNHELMKVANKDAIFMHCLPAHRGEEVSAALLEDEKYSMVWHEAENRLHAQKALMDVLLNGFS